MITHLEDLMALRFLATIFLEFPAERFLAACARETLIKKMGCSRD